MMVTTQLLDRNYFSTGDEINGYSLLEIIGGGGEGSVWSAWDEVNRRIVALKFFELDKSESDTRKRMQQLKALAALKHANIREVYSMSAGSGYTFFVMRYYPTGSLDTLLNSGDLSVIQVLRVAAQVASALEYIHAENVIHRDLKPTNVLLNHDQHAFLTDFGIARQLSHSTVAMHTGQGTPAYSSPEQHTRAFIDARTDIYSFGIMLYEMFTGSLPYQGFSSLAIKQLESNEEIQDPRSLAPELPRGLHGALRRITAANPDDRPETIKKAFALVLESFGETPEVQIAEFNLDATLERSVVAVSPGESRFREAQALLKKEFASWLVEKGRYRIRLTRFAFLDNEFSQRDHFSHLTKGHLQFLAYGAITLGKRLAFWWSKVVDPIDRLELSEMIFGQVSGESVLTMIKLLLLEPYQFAGVSASSQKLVGQLLAQIGMDSPPEVNHRAMILLATLVPDAAGWQPQAFSDSTDRLLAELSVSEDGPGEHAATLIGKVRSIAAVNEILAWMRSAQNPDPGYQALAQIRLTAGGLPGSVPKRVKRKIWLRIAEQQLFHDRDEILRWYAAATVGFILGLSFHVFLSTRLPSFLEPNRILNSIGSGLIFGPVIGLGILANRWIAQRLTIIDPLLRAAIGVVLGTVLVSIGFFAFHFFFLSSRPEGYLGLFGALIISVGYAIGDYFKFSRWGKLAVAAVSVGLSLLITYQAARLWGLTPMLYYESSQPFFAGVLMVGFSLIVAAASELLWTADRGDLIVI